MPVPQTGPVTERLRVREIDDDEGRRLVRIVRRGSGSVVTWRRAQMVLLSAQGMDAAAIAKVAFTSEDRGPRCDPRLQRRRVYFALSQVPRRPPAEVHAGPSGGRSRRSPSPGPRSTACRSAWSLSKLADFLVAEGVVDDISHQGLRTLLREEGVTFQRIKTLEGPGGPALCGEEGPRRAPVRDRRPRGGPGPGRAGGDLLRG